jgi:hypothetical protein
MLVWLEGGCVMNELVKAVGEKLDRYLTLPANWDSYGADPISEKVIADVRNFVAKLPAGVPVPFVGATNGIALT